VCLQGSKTLRPFGLPFETFDISMDDNQTVRGLQEADRSFDFSQIS
jgi:hypothetical protein